jgi:hypothetical protein
VAEHLDQGVAGEGLLNVGVERAGVLPLGDEALLRPTAMNLVRKRAAGIVISATSARRGEMMNIISSTPTMVNSEVSI